MREQQESADGAEPPEPAWLWTARAAATVSLAILAGPLLLEARPTLSDVPFLLGSGLASAYGVVLLLLAFRKPSRVFGAGLRVGILIGLVVLPATLFVSSFARPAMPWLAVAGLAQLALIVACARMARRQPGRGRVLGYVVGLPLVVFLLLGAVLGTIARHPPRYDGYAISDLRAFASAQAAYQTVNSLYGPPSAWSVPPTASPDTRRTRRSSSAPTLLRCTPRTCACSTPARSRPSAAKRGWSARASAPGR